MTDHESSVMTDGPAAAGAPAGGDPPPRSAPPRVLSVLGLVALAVSALLGGNVFGIRERLLGDETRPPKAPAVSRAAGGSTPTSVAAPTRLRSQPWWQDVATLDGVGPSTTASFTIGDDALQWRVKGTCVAGRLVVKAPSRPEPLLDVACAEAADEYGITSRSGPTRLEVTAEGAWTLQVQQQVDVPLVEPPLPEMTAPGARPVAKGDFYRIDQTGTGTITVYRLGDGRYALRLDPFFVTANVDLELRLSPLPAPHSTAAYVDAPSVLAAPLDVTTGSLNFVVPDGVDPTAYKSVVVWCPLINSAYAAATLQPAG